MKPIPLITIITDEGSRIGLTLTRSCQRLHITVIDADIGEADAGLRLHEVDALIQALQSVRSSMEP